MELTKLKGNTYFISAPTNIGVYSFKNKNCLVIDTGINNSAAKKIDEVIQASGLHVKYIINTHSHMDHCGGNNYFKSNYPGSYVYASAKEKVYMENTELQGSMIYSSYPVRELERICDGFTVDFTLEYGLSKINDEKFEIISLKGHSPEHIGVITPEKVCFLGDSIFSEEIIEKYSFPYLYHVQDTVETLERIKEIDADYFVLSHGERIYDREGLKKLVERNLENIQKYKNDIMVLLEKPLTREELLENLVILNDLYLSFKQYFINISSVSAFLKLLQEEELITNSIENGKLYYYRKER